MHSDDTFQQRVWHSVAAIPSGKVATYGDIAHLSGSPRAARQVGGVLSRLPENSQLPWHRVVNRQGTLSLTGDRRLLQRDRLQAEGIEINDGGEFVLEHYRWQL